MAGQDVVVTYRADVDDLTQKLKIVIDRMDKLEAESKQAAKGLDTTTKSADKLGKELADVGKTTSKATADVKGFAKTAESTLSKTGSSVKSIGLGIASSLGAAFTVDAVIEFSKASVNAFLESEVQAEQLKFAIQNIGGEGYTAYQSLIDQSEKFQESLGISAGSIQQAQAALASFGLSSLEIKKAIPVLLDYATVTGKDITQAANDFGSALQGNGEAFKRFKIDVSRTNSEVENYNLVLEGLATQQGAAAASAATLSGELRKQETQVKLLQESIGEKLAPAWVALKKAFTFVLPSGDYIKKISGIEQVEDAATKTLQIVKDRAKSIEEITGLTPNEAFVKSLKEEIELAEKARDEASKSNLSKSAEEYSEADAKLTLLNAELERFNENIGIQAKATLEQESRLIALSELQKKTTEDLITLKEREEGIDDKTAKQNIKNINSVIDARNKAFEEYKKNLELLRALEIQNQPDERIRLEAQFGIDVSKITATGKLRNQIIEQLQIELNAKLKALDEKATEDEQKQYDERDTAFFNSLENKKTAAEDFYKDAQKILTDAFIQETAALPEPEKRAVADSYAAELRRDEVAKLKAIDDDLEAEDQDRLNRKVIVSAETTKQIEELFKALGLEIKKISGTASEGWTEDMQNIASASVDLFNSLSQLYSTFANKRLEEINKTTEAELEALDKLSKANSEDLDKKRISEREFANNQKRIEEEKIKVQAAADKKSRDIKRKAALLDKASALFQIALSTAQNIASTKLVPLIVLYAAAGAAQAAIVAAQPIPYAKGTKSAKGGLSQVDEKGSEAILRVREGRLTMLDQGDKVLPAHKTVTYGSVLDKMFDGTFDKYYMKREIAPRMVAQRKAHEATKEKSFARNISESIVLNSSLDTNPIARQLGKGQRITNVDEIADAIARRTEISPYRR